MAPFIGIDGCRGGWCAAVVEHREGCKTARLIFTASSSLVTLLNSLPIPLDSRILIDMPVGLPSRDIPVRHCDTLARKILGRPAASSVFSPPCREALRAVNYQQACLINSAETGRKLSIQSWNITPRIRELDEFLLSNSIPSADSEATRCRPFRLHESHPEICFRRLNRPEQIFASKRTATGRKQRLQILAQCGLDCSRIGQPPTFSVRTGEPPPQPAQDDLIDAAVLALTAGGHFGLETIPDPCSVPGNFQVDSRGIPMFMVIPKNCSIPAGHPDHLQRSKNLKKSTTMQMLGKRSRI